MRRTIYLNLSLGFAAFVLILLSGEFFLRMFPLPQIYMNTRNIVQQTHSELSENPRLGYFPQANLTKPFRNREFNTMVSINSNHMRDREYSFSKPSSVTKRIAMVGDSFVFGWGVEEKETFSEILEDRLLKNTEVLNFGVSGYSPFQELEWLKTQALKFHPDIVFFFLYGLPELQDPDVVTPLEMRDGMMRWKSSKALSIKDKALLYLIRHSALFNLLLEAKYSLSQKNQPASAPDFQSVPPAPEEIYAFSLLQQVRELSQLNSFTPIFVYVPTKFGIKENARPLDLEMESLLLKHCESEKLICLGLTPLLEELQKKRGQNLYFYYDDHWNRNGHEAVAEILQAFLKEKNLL